MERISELLDELGWKRNGFWNNRMFFSLGSQTLCIHLYDGSCYHATVKGINYDKKLTPDVIREYTQIVKRCMEIKKNLKKHTAYEYVEANKELAAFVKEMTKK